MIRQVRLQTGYEMMNAGEDDTALHEYPLLVTEIRSYLTGPITDQIASKAWSRLPATPQELWAAYANVVEETPKGGESGRYLASPEGKKMREQFPVVLTNEAARDSRVWLKRGLKMVPEEKRAGFFEKVLPQIYGELLEDWGDPKGLVKMGLPASPVYGMAFAHQLIYAGHPEKPWTQKQWQKVAAQVEPEVFQRVCELAIAHRQSIALDALLQTPQGRSLPQDAKDRFYSEAALAQEWDPADDLLGKLQASRNVQALLAAGARYPEAPQPQKIDPGVFRLPLVPRILLPKDFKLAPAPEAKEAPKPAGGWVFLP